MKKFLISHIWWITLLIALLMLIAHTISYDVIKVDNVSIILLVVMLLSPFTTAITKIKIGDFEAEVNPKEVRKIKDEVDSRMKEADESAQLPETEKIIEDMKALVRSDSILALAKLRIELEKVLNKLYRFSHNGEHQQRQFSAGQLVYKLNNAGVLPSDIADSTREVLLICNRAIHGEDIRHRDAKEITEIGATLLRELTGMVQNYVLEPLEKIVIDNNVREDFQNSKYRVTSVVPLVENPYKNIRILDQIGFDELLEGYHEYAEFIVDVTKINADNQN